jgi:hypothetical protein
MNAVELFERAMEEAVKRYAAETETLFAFEEQVHGALPNVEGISFVKADQVMLHCWGDWRQAYRLLRRSGIERPFHISAFPYGAEETRAHVDLDMRFKGGVITLAFEAEDYRRFLRPGATCRVEPLSRHVVCE